ncbi:esterase-like activity of phytase family protein [Flaviflagellibacter deserti]|uniref:Esterase-like activity of phytase family protein n=1 Tax=Flaviflagellibacter deserti TaxID=2267266 RepID=A0ABV9Z615_9HYPH
MRANFLKATAVALLASTAFTPAVAAEVFNRVATFPVVNNLPADADKSKPTVSEIISVSEDGKLLVYTDSPRKALGMVDITDPAQPKAAGFIQLEGEPTSVKVVGDRAFAAVNTGENKQNPTGHLATIDIASKKVVSKCDLGGQPDSVAAAADKSFLTIAIENERDEDLSEGAIPQMPSGSLAIVNLKGGEADCTSTRFVDVRNLSPIAPDDAEPEFVDVNGKGEIALTLQENNHLVVVDGKSGKVIDHFPAGSVTLDKIDTKKDGVIALTGKAEDVVREPDAVEWLDDDRFVTANEGDWKGGSRGFTIFNKDGKVDYESGASFEYEAVRIGHYPDKRNKKGVEVEGIAVGTFGADRLIFVGAERASVVGVYKDNGAGKAPTLLQMLPGGVGPEGLLAIPDRKLFVTASEADNREDGGPGSMVTVYARAEGTANYPTIVSADKDGLPSGWGALSGAAVDPANPGQIFEVTDSFYSQGRILTIDTTKTPAVITGAITVTRDGEPAKGLDLEGIAVRPEGGFWLASEGNPDKKENATNSQLIRVNAKGDVEEIVELPDALKSQQTRFGFEGVAVTGTGADQIVWLAVQREWKDDAKGMTKLLAYKPSDKSWGAVYYPLDKVEGGWVGLSEITAVDGGLIVIERDNLVGDAARLKKLTKVSLKGVTPAPIGGTLPVLTKTTVRDLLPDLKKPNGYVLDKVESFAIDKSGEALIITDNDGVDGSSGETQFIRLGKLNLN